MNGIEDDDGRGLLIIKKGTTKAVPIEELVREKREAEAKRSVSPPPKPNSA